MEIKSTINLKDYKLLERIGSGAFGEVFKVKNKKTKTIYAAKVSYQSLEDNSAQMLRDLSREVNILSKIKHPSVLDFIGFSSFNFYKEKKPVIITELLPNGSLHDILAAERNGLADFDWSMTRKLINIYGIASAMFFLHSHHIIHRDLKPANILMDEYLCPKIADFGLSKILHSNKESMTIESTINIKGTPLYLSPEIWQKKEYGPACDVYAFAIIVLEIISNSEPFKNCDVFQIHSKVLIGERPEIDLTVPVCYRELIERCWSQDPKDRPSFEEIVNKLRLEENNQFITELIDETDFWNYVDFIDDFQKVFDSEQKIIKIEDFIKNKSKSLSKDSLKKSIFESVQVKTNDSLKNKKTSEKSSRFSLFTNKSKEDLIYPIKEFRLLDKDCQDLVKKAQNDAKKQFEVGCCLFEGKQNFPLKTDIGIKYLEQSIKGGCIDSLFYYSYQLIEAKVIQQDLNKAEKLLKKYLKSGNPTVPLLLGKIQKKEKNFKKAIKYFDIALKNGNCEAMYEYGKLLFKGKGCQKDEKEAMKYFEMSKKNGFDKSDDFLLKLKPEKTMLNNDDHPNENSNSEKNDSDFLKQKLEIEKKTINNVNQHSDENEEDEDCCIEVIKNIGKITKKNLNQGKAADLMLSRIKDTDGIERVISRIHSMDPSGLFTFKNIQHNNRFMDEALLRTDKTDLPISKFILNASNLIYLLVSNASDDKSVCVSNFSYPYELLSVNLLIDCSSNIPESNKMFNVLLLTSFAFALYFLHVPYEICVVADSKFRFVLKSFEEPHSIKALQRVLDCVLIQRYRTNYLDTFHHTVEFMNNTDEKRTQRAIFLFSDGIDENLVLINAWNKQVLNNSAISYGILVTLPQSLSRDNKIEMEKVWNQFADGTKNAVSITRISVFESNLNRPSYMKKIVDCFKDVISRAISIQGTYKPGEDPMPIFDFYIPDLNTNRYKAFENEIKAGSKIFVSIEKSVPLTSNKIHIDKLDISYYKGKTSKIIKCNVDEENHDSFVSFIHQMMSRQKNVFKSQLETIFKPNEASQTVLSNTGTNFDTTTLNYGVTVVIDTSVSIFNFISSMHSVKTVINVLCALSSVEIPCVNVILSTQKEPIILCSEVSSIHALDEKSSIWPALFSYILKQKNLGESNLEAGIHAAYDLVRMRSIDYSSILFVLTDGLYMTERKKIIKEHVMASIQLGINVIGVGIGIYPVGITDIFPQSVFAPNPNEIIRAISCCFGNDNPDPLEKIIQLIPDIPPNDSFLEIFNKFKEYDQNPVFSDLKEKLKEIPIAIDAFSDVYNEEQNFKGKCYKDILNPIGFNTEMYIENILEGQKILIVMLYSADYNLEENPCINKKYLYKNPSSFRDECVRKAVAFFGIDIVVVVDYDSAMDELMKRDNDKCVYYAVWVISGWKYEDNPYNYNAHHVIAFTQCLLRFWKSGGSVVLFTEGEPLTFQANYFLEQLTFPDGSKTQLRLHGNHIGGRILYGDDKGTLSLNQTFNRSNLFKKCQRSSIAHNLVRIFEGETISYADDDPETYKPFIPFSKDSEGGISALFYPFDSEHNTGDIFIDCGYAKLFDKMTEDGTFKYIQNIAGWTAHVENSLANHIKPKDYRPKKFEFNRYEFIDMKYKFDTKPDDDDDEFDIEVKQMKTLFAIDNSSSVHQNRYYYYIVEKIFNEKYKDGDLIMIWADFAKFIDYEEMKRIWTHCDSGGVGTFPQTIIKLIMNTNPPIDAEHLVLVTDGYIEISDVEICIRLVELNNIKFKMVETYYIGDLVDQSIGAIFQNDSPSKTYFYRPNLSKPEISVVSKKDFHVFDKLDSIDSLVKFEANFDSLFKVIKIKMMGKGSNEELATQLIELQRKIEENEEEETPSDFNRKIKMLIRMANGRIRGIFDNKRIAAILKH